MENPKLKRTLTRRNLKSGKSSLSIGGSILLTNNIPSKFDSIENNLDIENRVSSAKNDFDISEKTLTEEPPVIQSRTLKVKKSIVHLDKRAQ